MESPVQAFRKEKTKSLLKKKNEKATSMKKIKPAADVISKLDSFTVTMKRLREMAEKEANLVKFSLKDLEKNLVDPKYAAELAKNIHGSDQMSISEYVKRNTEILLNEHSSIIRQQVIEDMKKQMKGMSEQLALNSLQLESNISSFFELIENSYLSASKNLQEVIALAKQNGEKELLLKQRKKDLYYLERDVQELEEKALECLMCYAFIQSLYPSIAEKNQFQLPEDFLQSFGPSMNSDEGLLVQKKILENLASAKFDPVKVPEISASEIMKVIDGLKSSNLTLFRNRLLNKEAMKLEEKELKTAQAKVDEEMKLYDAKIASVEKKLQEAKELKTKLEKQQQDLKEEQLKEDIASQKEAEMKKMIELYNVCTGNNAKNVDLFLMKSSISYCLEDLFYELNKYPKKKVKDMFKALEMEKKIAEKKAEEALRVERLEKRMKKSKKLSSRK